MCFRSKRRPPLLGGPANGHGKDADLSNDDDDFVDAVGGHADVEAEGDGSGSSNDAGTGSEAEKDHGHGHGHAHAEGAQTASGRGAGGAKIQAVGLVKKDMTRVLQQRRMDKQKAKASGKKGAGPGVDGTRSEPGTGGYLSRMRGSPLAGQAGQGAGAGGGQFADIPGVTRHDCLKSLFQSAGRAPRVAPLQYGGVDEGEEKGEDSPELLSAGSGDGEGQVAVVAAGGGVGDGEEVNMGGVGGDGDGDEMDPELAEVLRASMMTYEAEERRRSGGHALGPSGPSSGGGGGSLDDKWRAIQDLPDVDVAPDGAVRGAPAAADAAGGGCRTPDHEPTRDALVPPPSPVRPKSHRGSKLVKYDIRTGEMVVPGRLRGLMPQSVLEGLGAQDKLDAPAPDTDPRPADDLRPSNAGVSDRYGLSSSVVTNDQMVCKPMKPSRICVYPSGKVTRGVAAATAHGDLDGDGQLVGAWGQAAAPSGGTGPGQATPAASVRPVAVDLTGQEDDEDKQLEQAILLSLQEVRCAGGNRYWVPGIVDAPQGL